MSRKTAIAVLWASGTLLATVVATVWMTVAGPRAVFLVGETTAAHHQIEMACETCHAAPAFSSPEAASKALNEACRGCHQDELRNAEDSHAEKLFRGPRMARYRRALDPRLCTSCHLEHRPEITRPGAVTVAVDFCVACHGEGEQDVRAARPSHAGLGFDTCASAGCHNYHDNRALYADFLLRHAADPRHVPAAVHGPSSLARSQHPRAAAPAPRPTAPAEVVAEAALLAWRRSAHAAADVNCNDCHAPSAPAGASAADIAAAWVAVPGTTSCVNCHDAQASTFAQGRHGMRGHSRLAASRDAGQALTAMGLSAEVGEAAAAWFKDPPRSSAMTVAEARLPMREDARHRTLDCVSCHGAHAVDVRFAAVEACAGCHADAHTNAYFRSPHYRLWRAELGGGAPGSGVACATCHMAKRNHRGKTATSHNQSELLRPIEKMIRPVCLHCHGLGFSMDALADSELVARNFRGAPGVHVPSIDWAVRHAAVDRPSADR